MSGEDDSVFTAAGEQKARGAAGGQTGKNAAEGRTAIAALCRRLRGILEKGDLPQVDAEAEKITALRKGKNAAVETFRRWRSHLRDYTASLCGRHDYEDIALIARCYDDPVAAPELIENWSRGIITGPAGLATALAEVDRLLAVLPTAKRGKRAAAIAAAAGMDRLTKSALAAAELLDKQALRRVQPKERALMEFVLPWLCRSNGVFGDSPKKCPVYRLMWAFLPSDDFQPGDSVTRRAQVPVPPEIKSLTGIGRYLRALAGKPTSACFLAEKGLHPSFSCAVDFTSLTCAWQIVSEALQPENLSAIQRELEAGSPSQIQIPGVGGEILAAAKTPYGWILVGNAGANRYEDVPILALIDIGGDDDYIFRRPTEGLGQRPLQIIVDLAGDDLYQCEGISGPGSGVMGIGVLLDRRGNDRYCQGLAPAFMPRAVCRQTIREKDSDSDLFLVPFPRLYGAKENQPPVCLDAGFAFGAGFLGIGLLVDEEGDDLYLGQKYAFGCGFWQGIGVLHDAAGNDVYAVGTAGLGVGINGAIGLLDDRSGDDHYQCLGTFESAYSADQPWDNGYAGYGIGYGASWRVDIMTSPLPTLGGGVGMIYDAAGNDVYISASFAIASGFGGGMGLLVDDMGNDVYFAKRAPGGENYMGWSGFQSLGNGCHRGIGMLLDCGGDDTYSANEPFGGGSAWDMSMGFLLDLGGEDRFTDLHGKGERGSVGCAAAQALAVCFNLDGRDIYERASFGDGHDVRDDYPGQGGNFAFFFDIGSEEDAYPDAARNQHILLGPLRWDKDERGRLAPAGVALSWDGEQLER